MTKPFSRAVAVALSMLLPVFLVACGGSDSGLSRADVTEIVRSELANAPAPAEPGLSRAEVEQVVRDSLSDMKQPEQMAGDKAAAAPRRSEPSEYTQFLVKKAIAMYESEGLDAAVAHYNTRESIDGQWYVFIMSEDDVMLAHAANPDLVNRPVSAAVGPNGYPAGVAIAAAADDDGEWFSYTYPNPATGATETKHSWIVRYDGLLFGTGWYERGPSRSDAPAYTRSFVRQAMNLYDALGLDATLAYYNTRESIDGQWYVFIMSEDDVMLAHAADPDLVNRPVSVAIGPNDYPVGVAIAAAADEDGEWFSYTFTNPATDAVETKHSWLVLHDGLVFGSGWYESGPSRSDAPAYTKSFVQQAMNLYDALGLDATLAYYNTRESIDGQWYVFIGDEDDVIRASAVAPDLVGAHASESVGPNGYPAGEAVAASADEAGAWFSYTFPNPATGATETKHSWLVRYDGLIFGSGWYEGGPRKSDAPAYTKSVVRQALNLYDAVGLERTVAYYKTEESVDGPWYVFIIDQDGYTISHHNPMFLGRDPSLRIDATGYFYGDEMLSATEEGRWVSYVLENPATGEDRQKHTWMVRHGGLFFGAGWYEE